MTVVTGCSSPAESSSSAAGATSGGSSGSSGGSSGSSVGGSTSGGSAAGGTSGSSNPGGSSGASAQAGAPGGANGGGAAGASAGGSVGVSGSAGTSAAAGTSNGGSSGSGGGSTGGFTLTSPAWTAMPNCAADNKAMCPVFPKENIGTSIGGSNKSPALDWTAGPSGTQSYAIVLQDLTNSTGGKPFVHWALWNIPGATRMLPAGLETTPMPSVPAGSSQRSFGSGYQGSGKCGNVYEFVLYALPMASFTPTGTINQTTVRDGLAAMNAPSATLRARSGAPGCTE